MAEEGEWVCFRPNYYHKESKNKTDYEPTYIYINDDIDSAGEWLLENFGFDYEGTVWLSEVTAEAEVRIHTDSTLRQVSGYDRGCKHTCGKYVENPKDGREEYYTPLEEHIEKENVLVVRDTDKSLEEIRE